MTSSFLKSSSSIVTSTSSTTNTTTMNNNTSIPALPKARFNWIFPAEKFQSTPSMRDGVSAEEELSTRQQAAVFIHELGSSLKLPHYCVNTAVVYMHRFFMLNSFQKLNRFRICAACLFLACKVEEIPHPLREVVDNTSKILKRKKTDELNKELITKYSEDIILDENILLSTLGFSLMVDHPHSLIVKTIQALGGQIQSLPEKTPRELAQTAYYLATKSILLTSFCVKYPPDLIAGFCIHLAAAWLKIEIPNPALPDSATASGSTSETTDSTNPGGRRWFHLLNNSFTEKQLEELSDEFLAIYEKCPEKIKKKLVYQNERSQTNSQDSASTPSQGSSTRPTDLADSVVPQGAVKSEHHRQIQPPLPASRPSQPPLPPPNAHQPPPPPPPPPSSSSHPHSTQSSSGAVRRESSQSFSSNNRSSGPPNRPGSYQQQQQPPPLPQQQQQQQNPSNHFQGQHHPHQGYHHSRYPPQQQRPGSMPPHRTSQPPPGQGMPSQYNMDRKSQPPMAGSHSYDHPTNMGPPGPPASSVNRGPPQRNLHHNNVPPTGKNPYPPASGNANHPHHPHPQSRMNMGGEKRNYESSYDPNHSKRARPS